MSSPTVQHISDTARWAAVYRAPLFRDPFATRLAGERGAQIARATRTYLSDRIIRGAGGAGRGPGGEPRSGLGCETAIALELDVAGGAASANCPVGTVDISGDGAGDQTVGSPDVKVLEGRTQVWSALTEGLGSEARVKAVGSYIGAPLHR